MRRGSAQEQGTEDERSLRIFQALNPIDHPERFEHIPWIRYDNASDDLQVPPDAARRFRKLLIETHYREYPVRIEVFEQDGTGHAFQEEMRTRALAWFSRFRSTL